MSTSQFASAVKLSSLYVNGLGISYASTTTLTVDVGAAKDPTLSFDITVSSALTLNSAHVGANGMDVAGGLSASSCIYIYLIMDVSGKNLPAVIGSLTGPATGPVIPFNFSNVNVVFLGVWFTDGSSHFVAGIKQVGSKNTRQYFYETPLEVLTAGSATSFTAVDLSPAVPVIADVPVSMVTTFTPATAADSFSLRPTGSAATVCVYGSGVVAAKAQVGQVNVVSRIASGVPKIDYLNSAGSGALNLKVCGFTLYI